MRYLQPLLFLGLVSAATASSCTLVVTDSDGFGGDSSWGGSDGFGGEGGSAGEGGFAGMQQGGITSEGGDSSVGGTTSVYTANDCAASQATAEGNFDDCKSCLYANQCEAAVDCENETGCMETLTAVLNCVSYAAAYASIEDAIVLGGEPSNGQPTSDGVNCCTSGALSAADIEACFPDWQTYFDEYVPGTVASDWGGAAISTDAEQSLYLGLGDASEAGCRAVCYLDERN